MLDRDNCVFHVKNLLFPKLRDINMHLEKCLFDGELTVDKFPDPHKKDENKGPWSWRVWMQFSLKILFNGWILILACEDCTNLKRNLQ